VSYPPHGRRSLALSTRAGRHGTRDADDHMAAAHETLLIGQIEDAEALEHLPEILDSEGLAGVFIGPADLSASLGLPGRLTHPTVAGAIERVVDAVLERPALVLCVLATDEHEAARWIERGARMVLLNAPALLAGRLVAIADALHHHPEQGVTA
jgi:4-hydroxy-2-oxoheptanedioate aldolase